MGYGEAMDDPAATERIAHTDRESAVVALREHAVAGRLTLEELAERVGAALTARTKGQLAAALDGLPPGLPAHAADTDGNRILGLFGAQCADAGEERPPPGAPVVHVCARTAFGALTVRRASMTDR